MFNRLKDTAKITDQDPVFKVKYVGNMETFTAAGAGCTTQLVQKVWDNSEDVHLLKHVKIKITVAGIHMKDIDNKKEPEKLFQIENITFCSVDLTVNDRIFSWIYRDSADKPMVCHVIYCSSAEKAKSISLALTRTFHMAYKDWKSNHSKEALGNDKLYRSKSLPRVSSSSRNQPIRSNITRQHSVGLEKADDNVNNKSNDAPQSIMGLSKDNGNTSPSSE